ncbi:MAG: hypothetical protein ACFE9M_12530 [Promethearchaeota archaeon]
MNNQPELLSKLTDKQKIEILRKNWMSHDARAQMAIVREFGWDKGNLLNKEIIGEVGKIMIYRLMNALRIFKIKNMKDFETFYNVATNFYYPSSISSYYFKQISDNVLIAVIEKCSTYDNIMKIGVAKHYECGCFAMRNGWYKAMDLKVEEELGKCLKNGDEVCEITIRIKKWNS